MNELHIDKTRWKKYIIANRFIIMCNYWTKKKQQNKMYKFLASSKWTEKEKPYFCKRNTPKYKSK